MRSGPKRELWPREYQSWRQMRRRCRNRENKNYPDYGGRGITICERWSDFGAFLTDMGPRPLRTTIHRVDNDGNYEPGNCAWADMTEQRRHTRRIKMNEQAVKVVRHCRSTKASLLAGIYGVHVATIQKIRSGDIWL